MAKLFFLLASVYLIIIGTEARLRVPEALRHLANDHRINSNIVGGQEAVPGMFPYQVSIQYREGFHFCGGVIIGPREIITAAHCCDGQTAGFIRVVAGAHNISSEEPTAQISTVSRILMHDEYDSRTLINDICLLELETALLYKSEGGIGDVAPILIPDGEAEFVAGTKALVAGWGVTGPDGLDGSHVLMYTDVEVVSDKVCKKAYGDSFYPMYEMGAAKPGKDACQRDSGGALACGDQKQFCGIVSWGIGCANPEYPGIYTRVTYYLDWFN